ncbi:MAG: cysteine desulfurase [Bdellovibrionales bacterium]|nr:cysteine desulfurase [Bdellovibrionales bacterium]
MSESYEKDFPQARLEREGERLVYLDNAATTLKPRAVIDRIKAYYESEVSNVHRGAHELADMGTSNYESARRNVANFINAKSPNEIVFTRGTTEGVNLVANAFGRANIGEGDEIILTELEHHSNIVPWQRLAEEVGAKIKVIPILDSGDLDLAKYDELLSPKTKMVSFLSISNALGVKNKVKQIIEKAKAVGAKTLVDAAQSVSTLKTDVQDWDCDFLVFSGHKLFGPNGIGVLYGKEQLLNELPPYQGGGSMIDEVTFDKTTYLQTPQRYEAGTPNVAGVVGLDAAVSYLQSVGLDSVQSVEEKLVKATVEGLRDIPGLRIFADPEERVNVVSFEIEGAHPSDVGHLLNQQKVAVRTGHHCCQPLMKRLGVPGTVRASFSLYNTEEDVDRLLRAVKKTKEFL